MRFNINKHPDFSTMKNLLCIIFISISFIGWGQNGIEVSVFSDGQKVDLKINKTLDKITSVRIDTSNNGFYPIINLPIGIEKLINLEKIEFFINKNADIEHIFKTLNKLTKLNKLQIIGDNHNNKKQASGFNCLRTIPESINNLENLEILSLPSHLIKSLPIKKGRLKKLKEIHINHNRLEEFPLELFSLPNIIVINLEDNYIKKVPSSICDFNKLRTLYIGRNPLTDIPTCLLKKKELGELAINHNYISIDKIEEYKKIFKDNHRGGWFFVKHQYNMSEYPKAAYFDW